MQISFEKWVCQKHRDRVKDVILKSKLSSISDSWTATESDKYKDKVYILDINSNDEYVIYFCDGKKGYNFFIGKRIIPSYEEMAELLKQRPELNGTNKLDLARVDGIDDGFIKSIIYVRENQFEKFLEEKKLKILEEDILTNIGVIGSAATEYSIIQIYPLDRKVMIIGKMSRNTYIKGMTVFEDIKKIMDLNSVKSYSTNIILEGFVSEFLGDTTVFWESRGYVVESAVSLK